MKLLLKRAPVLLIMGLLLTSIAACDPPTANVSLHGYRRQAESLQAGKLLPVSKSMEWERREVSLATC